jgi:pyrroline-5-carboxylate reductase
VAKTLCVEEKQLDGVTAISGSGPAYVFRLAEEVLAKSSDLGLDPKEAVALWAQTLRGAAAMLEGEASPTRLREQVTSPNGTTQAALEMFEEKGMANAFGAGLQAAYDRSLELG